MRAKLKAAAGETLVETLLAILVIALVAGFLSVAVVSAGKVNAKTQAMDQDFFYDIANSEKENAKIQIVIDGAAQEESVIIYQYNDYYFYGD